MTRPTTSARRHRRLIAVALALLLAVMLAACTIEQAAPTSTAATRTVGTPEAGPTTTAPRAPARPGEARGAAVTIAFGGDVHFEGVIGGRLARDPETALGPIATTLREADLAVVNLETAVTARGTAQDKQFTFRAPAAAFTALRAAGVDVATMANNHGMDFGVVGLADSMKAAAAARVPVIGIGRDADQAFSPFIAKVNGQRIAVVGATQVLDDNLAAAWTAGDDKPGLASAYQVDRLLAAVRAVRRRADTVVVDLHWGRELATCPIERQRQLAPRLVQAGADIVVGSHAHVLLGAGYLDKAYVDYGLGNFVFYSRGGVTARSGVLTLTVRGRAVTKPRWIPAVISGGIPIPLSGAAADRAVASWKALRGCTGLAAAPAS
ncbi:MAG TPA: CapA family protein [Actinomycetes bacterium]|nr:CapA family protein [Actinomycetes bacterium]